jgi:glutamyl-tRNA reductase
LAEAHGATAVDFAGLNRHLSAVDVAVFATASVGTVLTADAADLVVQTRRGTPLSIVDLAVPRDVASEVAALPGVTLIDLGTLAAAESDPVSVTGQAAAEAIVAAEVEAFQTWRRGADIAPAVAALRARAEEVVAAELRRLWQRRPDLTDEQRAEFGLTMHRVLQRLLHQPTVRMRELASAPGGGQYLDALRELLDLKGDPDDLGRAVTVRPADDEEAGS